MALYELSTDVTFRQPVRWQAHLRYALRTPGREVTLPAASGCWNYQRKTRGMNAFIGWPMARSWPGCNH